MLLESTRFCLIDDYICLSEQLPDAYNEVKTELIESISFALEDCLKQSSEQIQQPEVTNHDFHITLPKKEEEYEVCNLSLIY